MMGNSSTVSTASFPKNIKRDSAYAAGIASRRARTVAQVAAVKDNRTENNVRSDNRVSRKVAPSRNHVSEKRRPPYTVRTANAAPMPTRFKLFINLFVSPPGRHHVLAAYGFFFFEPSKGVTGGREVIILRENFATFRTGEKIDECLCLLPLFGKFRNRNRYIANSWNLLKIKGYGLDPFWIPVLEDTPSENCIHLLERDCGSGF